MDASTHADITAELNRLRGPAQITEATRHRIAEELAALPAIGTRYTNPAGDRYTVAGYHCDNLNETTPVLIHDEEVGGTDIDVYLLDQLVSDGGPLTEIPAEPATTARATETMRTYAERHYEARYTALADFPDVDTRIAYYQWAQADTALRLVRRLLQDAAAERSRRLDYLAHLTGSQTAAARLTGRAGD